MRINELHFLHEQNQFCALALEIAFVWKMRIHIFLRSNIIFKHFFSKYNILFCVNISFKMLIFLIGEAKPGPSENLEQNCKHMYWVVVRNSRLGFLKGGVCLYKSTILMHFYMKFKKIKHLKKSSKYIVWSSLSRFLIDKSLQGTIQYV